MDELTAPVPVVTRADRMRAFEHEYRPALPPKQYVICRVDGRAFHTYTRGMARPFDDDLTGAMNATAEALCAEIQGAQFAYTQSDEISVLITDFGSMAEQWFGGVIQKMASVAASVATRAFNVAIVGHPSTATFDARMFTLPDLREVRSYFMFRQHDCWRNAVSMIAEAHVPSKQLIGLKAEDRVELMKGLGVDVADYPQGNRYGRLTVRETFHEVVGYTHKKTGEYHEVDAMRSRWVTGTAPWFDWSGDCQLDALIPVRDGDDDDE